MLYREAMAMRDAKVKVEIEEMHTFGFEYLAQLVLHKIVNQCSADLPNRRVGCDVVARGAAYRAVLIAEHECHAVRVVVGEGEGRDAQAFDDMLHHRSRCQVREATCGEQDARIAQKRKPVVEVSRQGSRPR